MKAISRDWHALQYASEQLQGDREVHRPSRKKEADMGQAYAQCSVESSETPPSPRPMKLVLGMSRMTQN